MTLTNGSLAEVRRWDQPEIDEIMLSVIASGRQRAEEGDSE